MLAKKSWKVITVSILLGASLVFSSCLDTRDLEEKLTELRTEISNLRSEISFLMEQRGRLEVEVTRLTTENAILKAENEARGLTIQELGGTIQELNHEIDRTIRELTHEIDRTTDRIQVIEVEKENLKSSITILVISVLFSFLVGFGIGKKLHKKKTVPAESSIDNKSGEVKNEP